jgi:hypothetical protein
MKIEAIARAAKFADVPIAKFFCALRSEPLFGFTVTDTRTGKTAALMFAKQSNQRGVPWLAAGGLPSDDLAYFPDAVIKWIGRTLIHPHKA